MLLYTNSEVVSACQNEIQLITKPRLEDVFDKFDASVGMQEPHITKAALPRLLIYLGYKEPTEQEMNQILDGIHHEDKGIINEFEYLKVLHAFALTNFVMQITTLTWK